MFVPQENRQDGPRVGIATVCAEAADLLCNQGWLPMNPNRTSEPGLCAAVALVMSCPLDGSYSNAIVPAVLMAAHIQTGKQWRDIPQYNDAPGRTFEEVLAVLDAASRL